MLDLAVTSGVQLSLPVGPIPGPNRALELIDAAAGAGARIFGLTHSRGVSVILSFKTRLPFDVLPEWKPVRALSVDQQKQMLRDPAVRARLVEAAHHGDYGHPIGAEARKPDYDIIQVLDQPVPPNRTVAEVARQRGADPVELMIDLALETDFEQLFLQPLARYDQDALLEVMKHPRTVMTFSDSGAHVSQIADCSIQTHLLAHWVRDRQAFTLEEAVRMLTLAPATAWHFTDRGLLREGMVADINVFDADRVAPAMPTVETDLPGGAKRLKQRATGFLATVVAGRTVLRDGEHTGALPGALLRGPLAANRPEMTTTH
jgi:N-acyl-D-amino-acid deacylase